MATVRPFKGIVYNQATITDMAQVVTPPYDVISPEEEDRFFERHANNMVRLILGKPREGDGERKTFTQGPPPAWMNGFAMTS
jgi:uncharacterized protein (DUF1015 family)